MTKPLKHLRKYFFKYRKYLVSGIIYVALANIFSVYGAVYVREAFNDVQKTIIDNKAGNFSISQTLLIYALIIIGSAIIRGIFMYLMRQSLVVMSRHIEYDLKNEIYNQYQKLDASFYKNHHTGDLMNRISEDVSRVRMYVGPAIMYLVNLIVMFFVVLITMISVSPILTLYVLIPLPVLAISIYFVSDMIEKRSDEMQEELGKVTSFTQETFSGIRLIKAFARENKMSDIFDRRAETYRKKAFALLTVDALWFPAIFLLIGLSSLLVVYMGGIRVIEGSLMLGHIAEFTIYTGMLAFPFASLGWVVSIIQRARASQSRINEFLEVVPQVEESGTIDIQHIQKVELKQVGFSFIPEIPVLQDISFSLTPGKSLGITGPTGSGKSTLAGILVRSFFPNAGNIYINENDIKNIKPESYRSYLGYVPQDVFLFSDTIAQNILFGASTEINGKLESSATSAGLHRTILDFKDGYDTMLGERGITLSGGQKQRMAIARALYKNPELLIFDDCLSAVDAETEEEILNHLLEVTSGKMSVIISHRLSTLKHCDEIIVLHQGRISERGTHADLISKKSWYQHMYKLQSE